MSDVTVLIQKAKAGDRTALGRLLPLVYDELRRLARSQRRRHGGGETLNTTALVHEAYEKLARAEDGWNDRVHFFRVAARAVRQILVDDVRARQAAKRGGGLPDLDADRVVLVAEGREEEVLALDEALARLAALAPRQAEVVELRYFVGLTVPETGDVLDISPATVKREWTAARAWLYREMRQGVTAVAPRRPPA